MAAKNPILEDIRTGHFHPVYLIYGTESYLKKYYKNKLQDALITPEAVMNLNIWKGKDVDIPAVIDQADTLPFLSSYRLILIEDSGLFKKSCDHLAARIGTFPQETVIVFVEDEVDARGKLYKAVSSCGCLLKLDALKEQELSTWILVWLNKNGFQIQRAAMELFLQRCGNDLEHIESELEKLASYAFGRNVILRTDVEEICCVTLESRIFAMTDAIGIGDRQRALKSFQELLSLKEPPLKILSMLARHLNQLLQIRLLRNEGFDRSSIGEKIGVSHDYIMRKLLGQAEHFQEPVLRQALENCVLWEEQTKTGKLADRTAVELLIVFCTRSRE